MKGNQYELEELFNKMSERERENVYMEYEGEWLEFHFEVNMFYYVMSINLFNGTITVWSDEKQEEIFRMEN